MIQRIELYRDIFGSYIAKQDRRISFCKDGITDFFEVDDDDDVELIISDKYVKGAY